MSNEVSLVKKIYDTTSYEKAIDPSFTEFVVVTPAISNTDITVTQFFEYYDQLFFDIPVSDTINSHTYLVEKSQQYIGGSVLDLEKQALVEEINSLRQQLLDLNQTFTNINSLV